MKKIFIALAIVAAGFASCKSNEATTNEEGATTAEETTVKRGKKIGTQSDSLSYAMGVSMGEYVKNMKKQIGKDVNLDMIIAAIRDIQNDKYSLDNDEAMGFMNHYFSFVLPERKMAEQEEYLAKIEKETPGIQKTESGLMYVIIEPGSDVRAVNDQDRVRVMYRGTLKDGEEFDSSYKPGKDTTEFALNRVIKGWGEGMKLIGEGGKIKLWVPSELGYGARQNGPIGANEPLIFEVELFEVKPVEPAPGN